MGIKLFTLVVEREGYLGKILGLSRVCFLVRGAPGKDGHGERHGGGEHLAC